MDRKAEGNVIVIRRRVAASKDRHHGGAWKVAYADFVTAMMAFFLLMWLLSVTDENTRLGLADYFSPTIPIHSTRGGGDGPFDGSSMFSQDVLARDETGQQGDPNRMDVLGVEQDQTLFEIAEELTGGSGDAVEADPALQHIATRVTDEGLIIEIFDIPGSPLFDGPTLEPNPIVERLLSMVGRVLARTANPVAVTGHLGVADTGTDVDPWRLSGGRAQLARERLVAAGVTEDRVARVTGKADRSAVTANPGDARNRRIEITLLRSFTSGE